MIDFVKIEELSALEELARQCFVETFGHLYKSEDLEQHLSNTCSIEYFAEALSQGDKILIMKEGDALVGYAKYGHVRLPLKTLPDKNDREIHRLYVLASQHGKQLGGQLMEAMLADSQMQIAAVIYLGVWSENNKAQRFYQRYGFERCSEYIYYVGNHADDEFIMKRIKPAL